jgi:hypothetical protein
MEFSGPGESSAALSFTSMGILCGIDMIVLIAITFQRRSGLYFWSLLMATVFQLCFNISALLRFWVLFERSYWLYWIFFVPGYVLFPLFEYLVLYSRLSLLAASSRTLRWVLTAALVEVIFFELPTVVIIVGAKQLPGSGFLTAFDIWWRVEAVAYIVTDLSLCAVYIFHVKRMWGTDADEKTKSVLKHILCLAIFLMLTDIGYAATAFASTSYLVLCIDVSSFSWPDVVPLQLIEDVK